MSKNEQDDAVTQYENATQYGDWYEQPNLAEKSKNDWIEDQIFTFFDDRGVIPSNEMLSKARKTLREGKKLS